MVPDSSARGNPPDSPARGKPPDSPARGIVPDSPARIIVPDSPARGIAVPDSLAANPGDVAARGIELVWRGIPVPDPLAEFGAPGCGTPGAGGRRIGAVGWASADDG